MTYHTLRRGFAPQQYRDRDGKLKRLGQGDVIDGDHPEYGRLSAYLVAADGPAVAPEAPPLNAVSRVRGVRERVVIKPEDIGIVTLNGEDAED